MTCTLLLSKSLTNLRIFELDVTCPCLAVDAFANTTSVDTFFTNQAPSLFTPLITNVGTLDVFPSKELLDYFDQHLTLLYPTIKHIDILDKDSSKLKPATVETGAMVNVPLFVNEGELIRVNTKTGEYVERVKEPDLRVGHEGGAGAFRRCLGPRPEAAQGGTRRPR